MWCLDAHLSWWRHCPGSMPVVFGTRQSAELQIVSFQHLCCSAQVVMVVQPHFTSCATRINKFWLSKTHRRNLSIVFGDSAIRRFGGLAVRRSLDVGVISVTYIYSPVIFSEQPGLDVEVRPDFNGAWLKTERTDWGGPKFWSPFGPTLRTALTQRSSEMCKP